MLTSTFEFNGVSSATHGIYIVNTGNGIRELPFLPSQSIIEDNPNNIDVPYFYKTKKEPLSFTLTMTLIGSDWTLSKRMEVAEWLFKSEYKEFKTTDYTDKVFYVIATNRADFMTANLTEGYFTIEFRMNAPFAYTVSSIDESDLSSNPTTTDVVINCLSNVNEYFYPEIEVELKSTSTGFSIVNITDSSRETLFTGLDLLETIYMNNEKKQIISDTGEYRYDEFNKNWLRLKYGNNTLRITGNCIFKLTEKYPVFI